MGVSILDTLFLRRLLKIQMDMSNVVEYPSLEVRRTMPSFRSRISHLSHFLRRQKVIYVMFSQVPKDYS